MMTLRFRTTQLRIASGGEICLHVEKLVDGTVGNELYGVRTAFASGK